MLFDWDPKKAIINRIKHRIEFELAQSVFDDPFHLSVLESGDHPEERWLTVGKAAGSKILVVVHLYRIIEKGQEIIRIISARRATKREVKKYEEGI